MGLAGYRLRPNRQYTLRVQPSVSTLKVLKVNLQHDDTVEVFQNGEGDRAGTTYSSKFRTAAWRSSRFGS